MSRVIQVMKQANRVADPAPKVAKMTVSEMRLKLAHLQRIVNGLNNELRRLGSYEIEPDN
jgi:hypothetical protein